MTVRQFLLGNLHRPNKGEKEQKFKVPLNILGKSLDFLGDFPYKNPDEMRFDRPALFVRGTQSKYVPDEALPIIGRFFPLFKLVDIDAGHWVISEKPELFRQGALYDDVVRGLADFCSCRRILELGGMSSPRTLGNRMIGSCYFHGDILRRIKICPRRVESCPK